MFVQTTEILLGCKIKIFDNQETKHETIDRYTVVFLDQKENKQTTLPVYACLGMNGRPYHPQGFCQHSPATLGRHLGKRISFMELPADCQQAEKASALAAHNAT